MVKKKWSFKSNSKNGPDNWGKLYKDCKLDNQSPIDIDSKTCRLCNLLCQLRINYKKSRCNVENKNNLINIKYDEGSYITYKKVRYNVDKIVLHIPALHKIDNRSYDMEINIYHKEPSTGKLVIMGVFVDSNDDFSNSQDFFNQFVPPLKEMTAPNYSIGVSENWNVENVLPVLKNFYIYKGTLPYPPCTHDVIWIIFENKVNINTNDYALIKSILGKNNREIFPLNTNSDVQRYVYYNNSINMGMSGSKDKGKIYIKCKKIENKEPIFKKVNSDNGEITDTSESWTIQLKKFFDSSLWGWIKFVLIWSIIIIITQKLLLPSMRSSYTKTTLTFQNANKETKQKLLGFLASRGIDLSNDTWFNTLIIDNIKGIGCWLRRRDCE